MTLSISDAFEELPKGLRDDLIKAFTEIVDNFRQHRWEPAELNGGKLCEAVYTVLVGHLEGGKYAPRASKPRRFPQDCLALEQRYQNVPDSRSARILMPRMMLGLYDIRNNRGVGHAGADVDPNQMDATAVLHSSKWLMAELVRLLHSLTTEQASELVEDLTEREIPLVWVHEDKKRLLKTGLTWKQQTLIMLLTESGDVPEADMMRWLEHPNMASYRRDVLKSLHKSRYIEYDSIKRTLRILPPGISVAEALISEHPAWRSTAPNKV
ncbi:hypothetical protein [Actinomadura verrucosospora]